jgi:uncharacterized protein (TIGR02611 family)
LGKFRDFIRGMMSVLPHPIRWIATILLGFIIVIIGIIMLPLPGPGTLVIFLGITILALELEWAREVSKKGEQGLEKIVRIFKEKILKQKPKDDE